jgi:hypothetical protein
MYVDSPSYNMLFYNSLCCAMCWIMYCSLQERNSTDIYTFHTWTKFAFIHNFLMNHCRKTNPIKVPSMGVWRGAERQRCYIAIPLVDLSGCSVLQFILQNCFQSIPQLLQRAPTTFPIAVTLYVPFLQVVSFKCWVLSKNILVHHCSFM